MIYSFVSDSSTNNKLKGKKQDRRKEDEGETSVGHAAPQAERGVQFVHVL